MKQFIVLTLFVFGAAQSCIAADAINTTGP
jgi:hypothetical protein